MSVPCVAFELVALKTEAWIKIVAPRVGASDPKSPSSGGTPAFPRSWEAAIRRLKRQSRICPGQNAGCFRAITLNFQPGMASPLRRIAPSHRSSCSEFFPCSFSRWRPGCWNGPQRWRLQRRSRWWRCGADAGHQPANAGAQPHCPPALPLAVLALAFRDRNGRPRRNAPRPHRRARDLGLIKEDAIVGVRTPIPYGIFEMQLGPVRHFQAASGRRCPVYID
jgi:hypothetical protein